MSDIELTFQEATHTFTDDWDELDPLPAKFELCGSCQGAGKHVHKGVDAGGLTRSDLAEDPDFAEDYFSGRYDVTCTECNGKRVAPVIDWDSIPADKKKEVEAELDSRAEAAYSCHAEDMGEKRQMGLC